VLFVGGLTPRKGVLDLVAASTSLAARGVRHELWLVGGVPDEGLPAYEEVLRQLPDHVVVFGALPPDAMPGTYARVDVFCLPSWWEAMPLTVLEAQAAGLPVVATDVGDVQDMVLAGRTGLLVPPRDPQALEAALGALLEHGDLRARMGREARIHVRENFAQGQLLHELARTFDHLRGTP
jgi:glycosyltransferase involved in cell wall biosynthesis